MITHTTLYDENCDLVRLLESLEKRQQIELSIYCVKVIFKLHSKKIPHDILNLIEEFIYSPSEELIKLLNSSVTKYTFDYISKYDYIENDLNVLSNVVKLLSNDSKQSMLDIVWDAAGFSRFFIDGNESNGDVALNRLMDYKKIAISYFSKSSNKIYSRFTNDRDKNSILIMLDNMEDNNDNELFIFENNIWCLNIPYLNICEQKLDDLKILLRNIIRKDDELSYRIVSYIRNLYRYEENL